MFILLLLSILVSDYLCELYVWWSVLASKKRNEFGHPPASAHILEADEHPLSFGANIYKDCIARRSTVPELFGASQCSVWHPVTFQLVVPHPARYLCGRDPCLSAEA